MNIDFNTKVRWALFAMACVCTSMVYAKSPFTLPPHPHGQKVPLHTLDGKTRVITVYPPTPKPPYKYPVFFDCYEVAREFVISHYCFGTYRDRPFLQEFHDLEST